MEFMQPNRVWPTMITPFTEDNKIDYDGILEVIEWYQKQGVAGIFSVCQSSEMFQLSWKERLQLARFTVDNTPEHIAVVASGHVADTLDRQIEEAKAIIDAGIDGFVFISNKLANPDENEDVVKRSIDKLISNIHNTKFGIYECPYPYKRLITPETLKWLADTDRFFFLKDTCCNLEQLKDKVRAVSGSKFELYNANSATLLESLKIGCAGYSGVMANFHAELYVWLCENYLKFPEMALKLQAFLGMASVIEYQCYPINAKYHFRLEGLNIGCSSRVREISEFTRSRQMEVEQLHTMYHEIKKWLDK